MPPTFRVEFRRASAARWAWARDGVDGERMPAPVEEAGAQIRAADIDGEDRPIAHARAAMSASMAARCAMAAPAPGFVTDKPAAATAKRAASNGT